jgi:hypothetical protein
MMVCQLAIRNISFRIIDKNEHHTTQSSAIVIHAASMEIFAPMAITANAPGNSPRGRRISNVQQSNVILTKSSMITESISHNSLNLSALLLSVRIYINRDSFEQF